jgi:hypothetical protein
LKQAGVNQPLLQDACNAVLALGEIRRENLGIDTALNDEILHYLRRAFRGADTT